MKIGEAAAVSGLSVKAIRHYEALGLLGDLNRQGTYRDLSNSDVEVLRIVAHCRDLGFSLPEAKRVLDLVSAAAPQCPSPDAMLDVVDAKLNAIRQQIRALRKVERNVVKAKTYLEARRERSESSS